jgi:hypothetical protein
MKIAETRRLTRLTGWVLGGILLLADLVAVLERGQSFHDATALTLLFLMVMGGWVILVRFPREGVHHASRLRYFWYYIRGR